MADTAEGFALDRPSRVLFDVQVPFKALYAWTVDNLPEVERARTAFDNDGVRPRTGVADVKTSS